MPLQAKSHQVIEVCFCILFSVFAATDTGLMQTLVDKKSFWTPESLTYDNLIIFHLSLPYT